MHVISIHAPRVGSDGIRTAVSGGSKLFQSTLPVWGATGSLCVMINGYHDFNPRSPCGERLEAFPLATDGEAISIHAPRVGSDRCCQPLPARPPNFNPRSPCGERPSFSQSQSVPLTFQSTLPVWGATCKMARPTVLPTFQSTLPVWGATYADGGIWRIDVDFNPRSPCGERRP